MRDKPAVCYVLPHERFPVPELVEHGVAAERAGFASVWASDHFQPWQANQGHSGLAWMTLAALSQRTTRLNFGTWVTCPTFRYLPSIVAQAWATLSLLAPGRVFLGLGTGENLNEGASGGGWGTYAERSARLIEATEIITSLWSGKHVKVKGRFWTIDGRLYDPPAEKIPIYIAAGGPKSARVAAKYGDGIITGDSSLRPDSEVGAILETRRKSGAFPVIVEYYAVVGGEAEARVAAEKQRFGPKAGMHGYLDNISPADIQARAQSEIPLEAVYRGWTVSKEPEEHIRAILALGALGATHVVVHVPTPNQRETIEFFGKKVLPGVDARYPAAPP